MTQPHETYSALSLEAAYQLLYGQPATSEVLATLREVVGKDSIDTLYELRSILMRLDRQSHPSSVTIRFGLNDLRRVQMHGFHLLVDALDLSVSGPIIAAGTWEPHLTGVFQRYIKPGWRVADVGANVGYFTMLAASIVGSEGEVLAFEPNSENARLLLLNAAENAFSMVKLYPLALSDRPGHAYFSSFVGSNGGFLTGSNAELADGRGLVVPTATLDDLIKAPLHFMKLDVEGAEYRVLQGALALLASAHPIVTIEFSCEMVRRVSGIEPRSLLALFLHYGYSIHLIDRTSNTLQSIDDIDAFLTAWGRMDRIEDLLMLPAGSAVLP